MQKCRFHLDSDSIGELQDSDLPRVIAGAVGVGVDLVHLTVATRAVLELMVVVVVITIIIEEVLEEVHLQLNP